MPCDYPQNVGKRQNARHRSCPIEVRAIVLRRRTQTRFRQSVHITCRDALFCSIQRAWSFPHFQVILQGLLQENLPHAWHQPQEGLQDTRSDCSGFGNTELLEYVDKASGFTPLIAAIYYHKKAAVELVCS